MTTRIDLSLIWYALAFLAGAVVGEVSSEWPLHRGRAQDTAQWIRRRQQAIPPTLKNLGSLFLRLTSLVWAVIAGVVLVALPTFYALFPPQPGTADPLRVVLFVAWACVACLVVYLTATRDRRLSEFIEAQDRATAGRLKEAQFVALEELLRSGTRGTPTDFRWRIFLYDGQQTLLPYFPESDLGVLKFRPGQGAVGDAFQAEKPRVYFDAAVSDATLGLTPEQQERFRDLNTVVAAPIKFQGKTFAVLSAIARPHNEYFLQPPGSDVLSKLVLAVEAVLIQMSPVRPVFSQRPRG